MLDTNMVSYILTGRSQVARATLAALHMDHIACISSITEGELRFGLAKLPDSQNRNTALNWFLSRLQVLPWGHSEAVAYGPLRAKQQAAGKTLGSMDLLIAAHAIAVEAILVTRDKSFAQAEDLRGTENWATDLAH